MTYHVIDYIRFHAILVCDISWYDIKIESIVFHRKANMTRFSPKKLSLGWFLFSHASSCFLFFVPFLFRWKNVFSSTFLCPGSRFFFKVFPVRRGILQTLAKYHQRVPSHIPSHGVHGGKSLRGGEGCFFFFVFIVLTIYMKPFFLPWPSTFIPFFLFCSFWRLKDLYFWFLSGLMMQKIFTKYMELENNSLSY